MAFTLYNETIHSATKMKPREIFYAIRDNEERALDINEIIEKRDKLYEEVILSSKKTQTRNLEQRNRCREKKPQQLI